LFFCARSQRRRARGYGPVARGEAAEPGRPPAPPVALLVVCGEGEGDARRAGSGNGIPAEAKRLVEVSECVPSRDVPRMELCLFTEAFNGDATTKSFEHRTHLYSARNQRQHNFPPLPIFLLAFSFIPKVRCNLWGARLSELLV
jgi:hypothetical protein